MLRRYHGRPRTTLPWNDCEWCPVVDEGRGVELRPEVLTVPFCWRKPRLVLVTGRGDLFDDAVPDEYIAHVFAAMQSSASHTFRLLTSRGRRMCALQSSAEFWDAVTDFGIDVMKIPPSRMQWWPDTGRRNQRLPNVRLGVMPGGFELMTQAVQRIR